MTSKLLRLGEILIASYILRSGCLQGNKKNAQTEVVIPGISSPVLSLSLTSHYATAFVVNEVALLDCTFAGRVKTTESAKWIWFLEEGASES